MVYRGLSCGIAGSREPQLHTSGVHDFYLFFHAGVAGLATYLLCQTTTNNEHP